MTERPRIRVIIVDDHAVVRSGLTDFLLAYDDMELVGEAAGGEAAIRLCESLQPDVVVMDLMMPEMDGVKATELIRRRWPSIQVIALTSFLDEALMQRVLQAGATGYLLKNVTASELANAVRAAHAKQRTIAPEATDALIRAASHTPEPGADLTQRERELLALMAQGLNNNEIAERLCISRSTVTFHAGNIFAKLHVDSRTEAVALALRYNLIR